MSIMTLKTGVDVDEFCALSVITAEIDQLPSSKVGNVHVRSVAVAINVHCFVWAFDMAVTTTVSVGLASETKTVGELSFVFPSVEFGPLSEATVKETGFVTTGAVVSIVMVSCSEAATMSPAIN